VTFQVPQDSVDTHRVKVVVSDSYSLGAEDTITIESSEIPRTGLILYYPFNGNANDESNNGNHGTIYGTHQFVKRIIGNSLRLQGGYVSLPFINFSSLQEFSICLWVNEEGMSNSDGEAYVWFGDHHNGWLGIAHFLNEINFSVGSRLDNSPTPIALSFDNSDLNKDVLYCATYSHSVMKAYKNANLIGEKQQAVDISGRNSALAKHWWYAGSSSSTRFTGTFDEVLIYSRALSDSEIRRLYSLHK
jgi:hypothetical protein